MSTEKQGQVVAITVAIITVLGTLGAALIANWDKVFKTTQTPLPASSVPTQIPASTPLTSELPATSVPSSLPSPIPPIPVVADLAGSYTLDLRTQTATIWNENANMGCSSKGRILLPNSQTTGYVNIGSDDIMTAGNLHYWGFGNYNYNVGQFSGRIESDTTPMQWIGSAGDTELKGTWIKGQLSGEFVRRFTYQGKLIECTGTVSGFKKAK